MRGLEIPLDFSGRGVQREQRRSVKIRSLAIATPKVGVGRADGNEQHAPFFIDCGKSPGVHTGAVDPFISVPGFVIGFAGLWLMVDEAHITTIAMHPDYRRRGLGEFMLVSLIDIAYTIGAKWVTLEVRVSNYAAQNLYRKYGFREAGLRHRYYSDNQEDALIMWTDEINSPSYKQRFQDLKSALMRKLEV